MGSDDPRGKNRERRKHKLDGPTLTPTEQHIRNRLMRQFMRNPEGTGNADAYKSAPCWCECGRGLKVEHELCARCLDGATIGTFGSALPFDGAGRLLGPDAETPRVP